MFLRLHHLAASRPRSRGEIADSRVQLSVVWAYVLFNPECLPAAVPDDAGDGNKAAYGIFVMINHIEVADDILSCTGRPTVSSNRMPSVISVKSFYSAYHAIHDISSRIGWCCNVLFGY